MKNIIKYAGGLLGLVGVVSLQSCDKNFQDTNTNPEATQKVIPQYVFTKAEYDGTTNSMLRMAPAAITATLYRPFIWESKKISTLLSSLESLAMMLFTLYVFFRVGPFNFIAGFFKDPMVLFCFCFSLVFAIFVGATTLNFGTLVRRDRTARKYAISPGQDFPRPKLDVRIASREVGGLGPMCRGHLSIEQARFGKQVIARAVRREYDACLTLMP